MSLVRFKGQNHPQQTARRGPNPVVDDRATTPEVFAGLHARFGFTIDVAALPHNAKLPRYFTPEQDGLAQPWTGERLPANRTEQGWWQRWVEPGRLDGALQVEFLPGRMRFIKAGATEVGPNERPPFGVCLVIWA